MSDLHVVTGAFGFTGRHIAARLLAEGARVRTLTDHPTDERDIEIHPFNFRNRRALVASLEGAAVLYNTYWVRFAYRRCTFDQAVSNSRTLFNAARDAGVGRIVHVSITRPSERSPFAYFRGKAAVEDALMACGLPYAIVRPTVIFGPRDVFINNIAWLVRRFPVFAVPAGGSYSLQPVHVDDVARLCVQAGAVDENVIVEAAGPEVLTFAELIRTIAGAIGTRTRVVRVPARAALSLTRVLGMALGDVVLTKEELGGLGAGLVVAQGPPTGCIRLSTWLHEHRDEVGNTYASELARHYQEVA